MLLELDEWLTAHGCTHGAMEATGVSMLTAAYFMLRDGVEYQDLGHQYFAQRDKDRLAKRLLQRLRDLGVTVEVKTV